MEEEGMEAVDLGSSPHSEDPGPSFQENTHHISKSGTHCGKEKKFLGKVKDSAASPDSRKEELETQESSSKGLSWGDVLV